MGIVADPAQGLVWATLEGGAVQPVSVATGEPGPVYRTGAGEEVRLVAPDLGLVLATISAEGEPAAAWLTAYRLPTPEV